MCLIGIKERKFKFTCPVPKCPKVWPFFVLRHVLRSVMTDDELVELQGDISRNRIATTPAQTCPTCNSLFTRDFSKTWHGNRIRAVCPVCAAQHRVPNEVCWRCGGSWKSGNTENCGNAECESRAKMIFHELKACETKQIGKVTCPKLRACPQCGSKIEHTENCKHVTCLKCKCAFCFVCLKKKENGNWQCGGAFDACPVAARQTFI